MPNNLTLKDEIEQLRMQLSNIFENSSPDEILELSVKLDTLIAKYQKTRGQRNGL